MTDVIINRTKKSIHIINDHLNRNYTLTNDNVEVSGKGYVFYIILDGEDGKIILPAERTNVIIIGSYENEK